MSRKATVMTASQLAFSAGTIPHQVLCATAQDARIAVICGLPAMGKSLLLCELAVIAGQRGRVVHCLQWDITLQSFNQAQIAAAYPEIAGITHPVVRCAAGLWVRRAVSDWWSRHSDPRHLLVIEAPLVGRRFSELALVARDSAEATLGSDVASFLVPTPTTEVRAAIHAARIASTAAPRHLLDEKNARPTVVDALWREIAAVADDLGIARHADSSYSPEIYFGVYARLLQCRRVVRVPVQQIVDELTSPYVHQASTVEIAPTAHEAVRLVRAIEALGTEEAVRSARQWYEYCREVR